MLKKSLLIMLLLALFAPWAAQAQNVTIGTGTSTQNTAPIANYYNYSLAEMIFTAEEIAAGNPASNQILSVAFECTSNVSKDYGVTVYMKNVTTDAFTAASDYIVLSADDVVFTGTVSPTSGWTTITLPNAFEYESGSHLLVAVNKTSGGYSGSTAIWRYTSTSETYRMLWAQNDNSAYDPTGSPSLNLNYQRPNTRLTFYTSCAEPTGLAATLTPGDGTVATLAWTEMGESENWVLEYGTASDFTDATTVNVTGGTPSYELTGLTAETTYYARVRPTCSETAWSNTCEFKPTNVQTIVIEGTTAATSIYIPSHTNYDYSYTQQIYTATEIGNAGLITSVAFKGSNAAVCTLDIYLANTTKSSFSGTSDYINIADATQVFSGNVTFVSNDWKTIEFDEAFEYTGGNLAIIVDDNSGNYTYSTTTWQAFEATDQSLYFYQDSNDIDPTSPSAQYSGKPSNKSQVQLGWLPNPTPKPAIAGVVTDSPTAATVTWTAPTTAEPTGYAYQYKLSSSDDWGAETTVGNSVFTAALTTEAESDYDFRLRAVYGENYSNYATTSFTTPGYCMTPTNLTITNVTNSEATLTWQEEFGDGNWWLGYRPAGETDYTLVHVNRGINTGSHTLEGLTGSTTYDVVIYPDCDDTKTLEGSFTTKCDPTPALGYAENFDDYTGTTSGTLASHILPDCWNFINTTTHSYYQGYPLIYNSSYYSNSGNNYLRFYSYYSSWGSYDPQPQYAILPEMENLAGKQVTLMACGYNSSSTFKIGTMTDPEDASTFEAITEQVLTTSYQEFEYIIPADITGSYLAIMIDAATSSRTTNCVYIDDISIDNVPTCKKPSAVTKSNVTNHSVTLSWTNGEEGQDAWQIAYGTTSFNPNATGFDLSTVTVQDVTSNPYTFDKTLDAATTYFMYVRANCGDGDYSKWSSTGVNFTTSDAAPAPTAFSASNIGPNSADLTWTAPAGDLLSGYELYYVAAESAPEAPTAETTATATVSFEDAPTAETPYTLDGLTAETRYYIWVRANHGTDGYSAWTALSGSYFTTTEDCPVPDDLNATDITHHTATIGWTGFSDSYTVEYRTAEYNNYSFYEDFENDFDTQGWTIYTEGESMSGYEGWVLYSGESHTGDQCAAAFSYYNPSSYNADNWLITPQLDLEGTLTFWNMVNSSWPDEFEVLISTTGNDIADFTTTLRAMAEGDGTWTQISIDLSTYTGQQGYIAIHHVSEDMYYLFIDDFGICTGSTPAGEWQTTTSDVTSKALTDLTAGTEYEVQVQGVCDETPTEWSDTYSFTTVADNVKVFTTEGNWATAANWMDGEMPTITQNAIIQANTTIPNGCVATAKNVTLEGTSTLTIEEGGQLMHSNYGLAVTMEKHINGYGEANANTNNGYHLIAAPVYIGNNTYIPSSNIAATGLLTGTYDLYAWNHSSDEAWRNYKNNTFNLSLGSGYLYANQDDVELTFTGYSFPNGNKIGLTVTTDTEYEFGEFTLLGNPFVCDAYLVDNDDQPLDYYKMNDEGNGFVVVNSESTEPIAPAEGFFYYAEESGSVYFTREEPQVNQNNGLLAINLIEGGSRGVRVKDNAIVRFGEGNTLKKFQLNENSTKLYIPQDDKDYAVVYGEPEGEMPLNFKAETTRSYTIGMKTENVNLGYLHLIDLITGADVDMLAKGEYSFIGSPRDSENRFVVRFSENANINTTDEVFVYQNGDNIMVGGEGELQVFDVTGRMVLNTVVNGLQSVAKPTSTGVYIFRLVGTDVKTQKIVVR